MTTLHDAPWLTHAEYRELVGAPPLALVAEGGVTVDSLGRRWDPRKHPRGRDGRFIEVGGLVKFFDSLNGRTVAGSGTVTRIDGDRIYVNVTSSNRDPAEVGGSQVFNRRQIATIPPGEVRLDRRGNVKAEDRELPDKNGKLVRVGDTVKVDDVIGKVTRVDDNSGRVVVRNDEGFHAMRRVETVERLDDGAPAAPAGAPAARLDAPAPTPAAPGGDDPVQRQIDEGNRANRDAQDARQAQRDADAAQRDGLDEHGNAVPDGWERKEENGRVSYERDGYRVTPVNDRRYPGREKRYRVQPLNREGRPGREIGMPEKWDGPEDGGGLMPRTVEGAIAADRAEAARLADVNQQAFIESRKPDRGRLQETLDRQGFSQETKDAVRFGTDDEIKEALENDPAFERLQAAAAEAQNADFLRGAERLAVDDFEKVRGAVQYGVRGRAEERDATPEPARSEPPLRSLESIGDAEASDYEEALDRVADKLADAGYDEEATAIERLRDRMLDDEDLDRAADKLEGIQADLDLDEQDISDEIGRLVGDLRAGRRPGEARGPAPAARLDSPDRGTPPPPSSPPPPAPPGGSDGTPPGQENPASEAMRAVAADVDQELAEVARELQDADDDIGDDLLGADRAIQGVANDFGDGVLTEEQSLNELRDIQNRMERAYDQLADRDGYDDVLPNVENAIANVRDLIGELQFDGGDGRARGNGGDRGPDSTPPSGPTIPGVAPSAQPDDLIPGLPEPSARSRDASPDGPRDGAGNAVPDGWRRDDLWNSEEYKDRQNYRVRVANDNGETKYEARDLRDIPIGRFDTWAEALAGVERRKDEEFRDAQPYDNPLYRVPNVATDLPEGWSFGRRQMISARAGRDGGLEAVKIYNGPDGHQVLEYESDGQLLVQRPGFGRIGVAENWAAVPDVIEAARRARESGNPNFIPRDWEAQPDRRIDNPGMRQAVTEKSWVTPEGYNVSRILGRDGAPGGSYVVKNSNGDSIGNSPDIDGVRALIDADAANGGGAGTPDGTPETDWSLAPSERFDLGMKVTEEEADALRGIGVEVPSSQIGAPPLRPRAATPAAPAAPVARQREVRGPENIEPLEGMPDGWTDTGMVQRAVGGDGPGGWDVRQRVYEDSDGYQVRDDGRGISVIAPGGRPLGGGGRSWDLVNDMVARDKAAQARAAEPREPVAPPANFPNNIPGLRPNMPENAGVVPDDDRFVAADVDQMLRDLPLPPVRRRGQPPLGGAARYNRNLRLALQDMRQARSQEQRDQVANRVNDYFRRALEGRPEGDANRARIEDVQRRFNAMRAGGAAPEAAPEPTPGDTPDESPIQPVSVGEYERLLRQATNAPQVDELADMIENDPNLTEDEKFELAGVVNEIRDNGPANASPDTPTAAPPRDVPDVPAPGPYVPVGTPELHSDVVPPDAQGRVPRVEPGIRGRGAFVDEVITNRRGEELRLGVIVRLPDGREGWVTRMHPPSNRVVVMNNEGLHVQRNANRVFAQYEGDAAPPPARPASPAAPAPAPAAPNAPVVPNAAPGAARGPEADGAARAEAIVEMHAAGARRGFPLEAEVGRARANIENAVRAARDRNQPEMVEQLDQAVTNYDAAILRGIRNPDLAADVQARRDAAQELLDDLNAGRAFAGDPDFDPILGLNGAQLREARAGIPTTLRGIRGVGDGRIYFRNAGFALDDAVDLQRDAASRQRALARAITNLERARDANIPGAAEALDRVNALRNANPAAPGVPGPAALVRPDVPRPNDPNALNPDARGEDYAQTWGIERGDEIARAARERPSIEAIRGEVNRAARLRMAQAAFDGQYGNGGLEFKVTEISGGADSFTAGGKVYKDGRMVGTFSRQVGRTGVYNAYFQIESSVRAGGAATEFNRHMENWYIANGIREVTVGAGLSHGGFVWARNGFDWDGNSKYSAQTLANNIERVARTPEARAQIADIKRRIDELDMSDPNFPTPYELSTVGWQPGMGRNDSWAGKDGMLGTGWNGKKTLDPNTRAYQQQVAAGRMPNPADNVRPAPPGPRMYTAADIPDDIRGFTPAQLEAVGPKGSRGQVGRYNVLRMEAAHQRNAAGVRIEDVGGVNDSYVITDPDTGRQWIVKLDVQNGAAGARAEVDAADLLQATGQWGAARVEISPTDGRMIISTFSGEQEGATNYRSIGNVARRIGTDEADAFVANMANPQELVQARIANAIIANFDRHGGNGAFVTDADGKDHLVLWDHGLSLNARVDNMPIDVIVPNQVIAYARILKARFRQLGQADSIAELSQIAQLMKSQINSSAIPAATKAKMLQRLDAIIADPAKFYNFFNRSA